MSYTLACWAPLPAERFIRSKAQEVAEMLACGGTEEERARNGALIGKLGKKALSFLQYLIVNHGRNISSEELIEQFWGGNSSDPANALRNMLFKVRSLLKAMFPEQEKVFLTLPDCYAWSPEVRLELDTERMEADCLEAKRAAGEERCRLLGRAASLYRGDFLSGNDSDWARSQRQYYRTLYLDACQALLPMYYKKEQWMELLAVCGQEYGMPPTERIEQLHTLASGLRRTGIDDEDIFKLVYEEDEDSHAFFCTFATFQSIVALVRRHMTRSGQTSCLVIISLGRGAVPTTDGRRLERILLEKLRTGDPIARLEAGSYILMLTGADEENARLVASRIDCAFHRTYRHSTAKLSYRVADLGTKRAGKIK